MVRSPRAFMTIADSAVASPPTRWQCLQSTFSRASALSTRSPLASSPAGPPIGPASAARPPSRATATAAFAAQPPLTTKKSLACTLPSGRGNSSTRNTSSSTIMPAQRMRGAESAEDIAAVLDIVADDVVSDRDRRRRGQALRMLPLEHQCELVAVKPARVFKLVAVHDNGVGQRLGMAADHDRRRKRPRLRGEIAYAPAVDTGLLGHFAPHRFLDGFPRLGEAGQARPHGRREAPRAAKHAAFTQDHQHDHDRIGARKMLRLA